MIFPPASPVVPVVIENPVPAESRIGKPYQNLYQTESDGFVPEDADTHGTHVQMRQNGTKTGHKGAIPTLASISNCVRSKELGATRPKTDTGTDTNFGTPSEFAITGGNSPATR
jgi:hypothetical protein